MKHFVIYTGKYNYKKVLEYTDYSDAVHVARKLEQHFDDVQIVTAEAL